MNNNLFENSHPNLLSQEAEQERKFSSEEIREKLRDPSFLPSFGELTKHLGSFRGSPPYESAEWKEWHKLVADKERPIFEFWTKEYVNALGTYLARRVEELAGTEENPTVILEVGAGNGRLTYFLQEKLSELIPGKFKAVATDSGRWKIPPAFPVENIPHDKALARHKPKIVIFSWMPYKTDYTADFRFAQSVDEYILIGEVDGGCCGDEWNTWGLNWGCDDEEERSRRGLPAPYKQDGFEKQYHGDLGDLQLSRMDILEGRSTTSTVSFRRK